MSRRCLSAFAVFGLLLAMMAGGFVTGASAQDASPVPIAPPQDLLPATWDEAQGQTAHVNGIDLYYEIYGQGEPLLLLHGGLGNGTYFRNQIPVFAAKYQVIVVDSRGHGRSTFDDQPISYELMASDVLALLDQLKIAKAGIVGWSDGGIIGLEIAIHHPERLTKVVAYGANFDPTGVRLDIGQNAYFNAYIAKAYEDYLALSPQPERWDAFLANISNMWATEPNYSDDQLKSITTPFLILDGAKEEAIDLNQTKLMALLIPNASLTIMPDTGHFAMFEQPQEFNTIALNYLSA